MARSTGQRHQDVLRVVEQIDGPFLLSPFVLAELDYMLIERHAKHRHFRAMGGPGGRPFRLLPDDFPA